MLLSADPHEAVLCAEDLQHEVRDLVDVVVGILPAQVVVLDIFPNQGAVLLALVRRADRIRYVFSYFFLLFFSIYLCRIYLYREIQSR